MSPRAILSRLGGRHQHHTRALKSALRVLLREGQVERLDGRYRLARSDGAVEGRLVGAEKVVDESGAVWRVPATEGTELGDHVLVQPIGRKGRAELLGPIGERRDQWVGMFERERGRGHVTPYRGTGDWRLRIAPGADGGARPGEIVVAVPVESERAPTRARRARRTEAELRGRVVERLGRPGDPEAAFRAVSWRHRLPVEFSEEVLSHAAAVEAEGSAVDAAARRDLRRLPFVTIDPATARDHDDAVCVERLAGGSTLRLWVAIADVGAYVPAGSPLDREALRRGNSVYFTDRAIPMLPERLSGDLCSLRPDVDRLAIAVELCVDESGGVGDVRFHEAVIRSRARLSYEEAAAAMGEPTAAGDCAAERAAALSEDRVVQLRLLAEVAERLRRLRFLRGSIDFDLPSSEVVLGEDGRPVDVVESPRTVAHRTIEEAMLAANRAVASALERAGRPSVFRIHEPPLPRDIEDLRELLESLGLLPAQTAGGEAEELSPRALSAALARAEGRPEEELVNLVALRAMRQARYHPENRGHYALGFRTYVHFTSPIRRYADLVVHRALRSLLRGEPAEVSEAVIEKLQRVAVRISWRERVAMEAEREIEGLAKCAFLFDRVGEVHPGHISSVAHHGLYVRLEEWAVEGLVPIATLPGHFDLEPSGRALVSRRGGRRHGLGDRVQIRIERVDWMRGWITFSLQMAGFKRKS